MLLPHKAQHLQFPKSAELTEIARSRIPGGAHTYARGEDQYPEDAPSFFVRGEGCRVWSAEGAEFIEYGMGNRAVTLGHAYGPVIEAANRQMQLGTGFVRPARIELELAERMLSLFPNQDYMVKFAKHGSDATSAAIKLARAYTGRDIIAICGDQPFFSVDDWFIGSTALNAGIPQAVRNLTVKFGYNDLASLEAQFASYPGQVACVVMEAVTKALPDKGYLEGVRRLCDQNGTVLVFDEIITGFRLAFPAVHPTLNAVPDMCAFSKAMSNGFSLSALVGKREIMRLGGMDHDRPRVFLMSTTHGGETHSMAAALKVIEIYEQEGVVAALARQGGRLRAGIEAAARSAGVERYFQLVGFDANLTYLTKDRSDLPSQAFRTLFMEQMIERGIVGPSFVISRAHDDAAVDRTVEAAAEALKVYALALDGDVERFLKGRSVRPVWRTYGMT